MIRKILLFFLLVIFSISIFAINKGKKRKRYYKKPVPVVTKIETHKVWGIDLSHHQVISNWETLLSHKPNFIFLKASEGVTHCDKMFDEYWDKLRKNNITRGAYHFFSYSSPSGEQANHFISHVSLRKGDLPPVLDLEYKKYMPSSSIVKQEILNWVKIVERHYGVKPIIYTNPSYYNKYLSGLLKPGYHYWISDYRGVPPIEWSFWQSTEYLKMKGVKQYVDLNYFSGTKSELEKLLIKGEN